MRNARITLLMCLAGLVGGTLGCWFIRQGTVIECITQGLLSGLALSLVGLMFRKKEV